MSIELTIIALLNGTISSHKKSPKRMYLDQYIWGLFPCDDTFIFKRMKWVSEVEISLRNMDRNWS